MQDVWGTEILIEGMNRNFSACTYSYLYLGTNKTQPFEFNTFQRGLSGHGEMSPAGNISGSSLAALYTSSLKKSLIDFLFLLSISSHGNLKADLVRKNDVITIKPSTLQRSRACRVNYVNPDGTLYIITRAFPPSTLFKLTASK